MDCNSSAGDTAHGVAMQFQPWRLWDASHFVKRIEVSKLPIADVMMRALACEFTLCFTCKALWNIFNEHVWMKMRIFTKKIANVYMKIVGFNYYLNFYTALIHARQCTATELD